MQDSGFVSFRQVREHPQKGVSLSVTHIPQDITDARGITCQAGLRSGTDLAMMEV